MQNASTGNLPLDNTAGHKTTTYFNNFFKPDLLVNQNLDDSVQAYFETITGNREAARVLASTVLYTAITQGLNPMDIVTDLYNLSQKNAAAASEQSVYTERKTAGADQYATPGPNTNVNNISEVNAFLTVFLNLNRVNTSLLGISNQVQTSKYVSRAILP